MDIDPENEFKQKEKMIYKDYYLKKFGMKKIKQILVGKECQVDPENIPLITDILDQPEIYEQSKCYHDY